MKTVMSYNDAKRYVRSFSAVRYVEEKPFIIAIVELQDVSSEEAVRSGRSQRLMVAKGLSTCSPTDKWNTKRGQDIARGRAEAKLARRIMRQMAQKSLSQPLSQSMTISVPGDVIIDNQNYYQL